MDNPIRWTKTHPGKSLAVLAVIVAGLAFAIPPEATLGGTIRVVLLHGALARTGLVVFAAAAALALLAFVRDQPGLHAWTRTLQWTAFWVWVVYFLSSIVATWLTWGVPVAWSEPRTQASIKILIMAAAFLPLARWVGDRRFVAGLNIAAGIIAITLTRLAPSVQHPVDPVMGAGAAIFPILFVSMWIVLTIMVFVAATAWHTRRVN